MATTFPTLRDWNAVAQSAADYAARLSQTRHGAMRGDLAGTAILYGNEGYRDDRPTQQAVERLRQGLEASGISVLGFALDRCDAAWAMIVDCDDLAMLQAAAREAWPTARPRNRAELCAAP